MKLSQLVFGLLVCFTGNAACGQWIVAHRGASHDAPENTLASVRLAVEQGADGVETDYYLSSDGKLVCIHDPDTERVAGKRLLVKDAPLAALQALDIGVWKGERWRGERVPTLDEVLANIPPGTRPVIELKIGPEIVAPLAQVLEASSHPAGEIIIISFNADTIAECERRLPEIRTHWLSGYKEEPKGHITPTADEVVAVMKRTGADGFGSQARTDHFDEAFIKTLRENNCDEFHVWTIDDPELAKHYQKLGAKWITTNRPGWLKAELGVSVQ